MKELVPIHEHKEFVGYSGKESIVADKLCDLFKVAKKFQMGDYVVTLCGIEEDFKVKLDDELVMVVCYGIPYNVNKELVNRFF